MLKVSSLRRVLRHGGGFTACLIAVTLLFVNARLADAQALYGSIVGNVTDAQGATVPGVTLTATNTGTALEVEAVTDGDGAYTFRNLLPGTYDVKAVLSGFREHKETAITVAAGNPVRVNIALVVGSLTETVQVAADTTLLQTDKADLSTQLNSKEITDLPLNQYRNYQALINLVPGATPAQFQNAEIDSPGRSLRTWVNGTQPNSNATRIDGAVSVNLWLPHHVGYVQPAETIETVNVSTNSFDAEYGMAGGAATTVITKSGTNNVRGSAFWFGNTDELNANTYFNNAFGRAKDELSRNIYGGTVGGPVVHNKLFYFGSFERFADTRGSLANYGVPTARMRNGDFGEVAAAYANFRLYNPFTGGAGGAGRELFANNTIPSSMINGVSRDVMDYYPLPNTTADLNSNQIARRLPAVPRGHLRSRQLRPQDDLAAQRLALGVGQVLDARRGSDRQLLARLRRGQPRRHARLRRRLRPHLDAEPDARPRRQLRRQHPEPGGHRAGLRRQPRARHRHPRLERPGHHARAACRTSPSAPTTTPATTSARRRTGCRCSARSGATRSAPR